LLFEAIFMTFCANGASKPRRETTRNRTR